MRIAFITNLRAPYRNLQLSEFGDKNDFEITIYYTNKPSENRVWNTGKKGNFKEIDMQGIKIGGKYGYINWGLFKIIKNTDLILFGGYEQPTILILAILCKVFKRKYAIVFDGITVSRLNDDNKGIKDKIKNFIVKNSSAIFANGTVGKLYFTKVFKYKHENIYNQYLSVDSKTIEKIFGEKIFFRDKYKSLLKIEEKQKVLLYSGRLIDIKNVESVIKALGRLQKVERKNIVLVILGGGILEEELMNLSEELNVEIRITGFIKNQKELFELYCIGDALILPSKIEPWGLVVNEAMHMGLPVIVSKECGCSLDLVDGNGYLINPNSIECIKEAIINILNSKDIEKMSNRSREIISKWNNENSQVNFLKLINNMGEVK